MYKGEKESMMCEIWKHAKGWPGRKGQLGWYEKEVKEREEASLF